MDPTIELDVEPVLATATPQRAIADCAVRRSDGRLELFGSQPGRRIAHLSHSGGWLAPEEIAASSMTFGPDVDVCSWAAGRLDVFATCGMDDGRRGVAHAWAVDGTGWGSWDFLGGPATPWALQAVSWEPGRLDVFAWDDAGTHHLWHTGGRWSSWEVLEELGAVPGSRPTVSSSAPGQLDFIAGSLGKREDPERFPTVDVFGQQHPWTWPALTNLWQAAYRADGGSTGWWPWEELELPGVSLAGFWSVSPVRTAAPAEAGAHGEFLPAVKRPPQVLVAPGGPRRPRRRSSFYLGGEKLVIHVGWDEPTTQWVASPAAALPRRFENFANPVIATSDPSGSRLDLFLLCKGKESNDVQMHYWSDDGGRTHSGPEVLA